MNVLILLKNSSLDQSIVNFAASIFNEKSINLHLLNLVEANGEIPTKANGEVLDFCTEFDLSGYRNTAAQNLSYLKTFDKKLIKKTSALVGDRIKIIKSYAKEHLIDVVVGGAHKTSVLEDIFVQTFASSIMEEVDIPFLTIKCNRDHFSPKKIGIIKDFRDSNVENHKVLANIKELHNSEINLIKIKTPDDKRSKGQMQDAMDQYNKENWLNAKTIIKDAQKKEEGIEEIVKENEIDLIVFSKNQHKSYLPFTKRKEKTDIVNHIYAPILIY